VFVPWEALSSVLARWREERRFAQAFFLRKPPGLRLRFMADKLTSRLEPELVAWLLEMEQRNLIRSFHFATYEPEVFLFGGAAGLEIAHEHFDRDTRLVLEYEARAYATPHYVVSAAVLNDLFLRYVEDRGELWDIWMRVWHAHGAPRLPEVEPLAPAGFDEFPDELGGLAQEARLGNARIASRLRAALVTRQLDCGPRAWLAQVAAFHWNRWGLGPAARMRILAAMLELLDPHRVSL
jgi:thiopeptide-type bacteriocin biosynthesis protein